ncbi:MAG: ribosome assembly factor SBDS [Euryarchaeota archaeon]|jgi:ribosome maturation protein SDO1|nr:ribosome assembly factor SBDS [Euryarchaeota archaeon]MBT4981635.1 ribosome assembly factor SBDS [Euryarchaeota archaeon]MBT5183901.1 ribosome assembly factor SBDS [Euryarchaeota archaeon]
MVSLDKAVLARWEHGGKRYEILVDPDLVDAFRSDAAKVDINDFLATDEVWHDARGGDRPTEDAIDSTFGTQDISEIAAMIIEKGSIQLTTNQRKDMVEQKRQLIIQEIHSTAIDPKAKTPHPKTRIELALDECRFSVDPFKRLDVQVKDAINALKPLIPLSFEPVRIAFRISSSGYGGAGRLLRPYLDKEEWLSNGDWACIIECPPGLASGLIGKVKGVDSNSEAKEL